jgi:hypothetical protein
MTDSPESGAGEPTRESLAAAEADLAQLREVLQAAARGAVGAEELKRSAQSYLAEHGATLRGAAISVGEEARRGVLDQLYAWRAQLSTQLPARKSPT